MMKPSLLLAILLFAVTVGYAAPVAGSSERDSEATRVAKAWFTSLMQGKTEVTTSLSAVPFSFDRKQVVATLPELKKLYDEVVGKKGKRDLQPTSEKVVSSTEEKVEVVLMIDDEGIAVTVKAVSGGYRVVGFSD